MAETPIIPDGLRDKADGGDLGAQRLVCEHLAAQLNGSFDVIAVLDRLEHYAQLAAASGEHQDLCLLVWVHAFRAGYHQGEDEEIFALADAVVLIDEMADSGFEDAAPALYAVSEEVGQHVADEVFSIARTIRASDLRGKEPQA